MKTYRNKKLGVVAFAVMVALFFFAFRVFAAVQVQYEFLPSSSYTQGSNKATIKVNTGTGSIPRQVTWLGTNGVKINSSGYVDQQLADNGAVVWRTFDFYISGNTRPVGTYTAVVETYDMDARIYVEMFRANFTISGGGPVITPTPVPTLNPVQIGKLDLDFGSQGLVTTDFRSGYDFGGEVALQEDGKIVEGGSCTDYRPSGRYTGLVRYTSSGSLDPSFGEDGKSTQTDINQGTSTHAIALQKDGKIVAASSYKTADKSNAMLISRYNPNGSLDESFGNEGRVVNSSSWYAYDLALQEDGKILAVSNQGLWRFNSDGSPDPDFGPAGKAETINGCDRVAVQKDGKILALCRHFDLQVLWRLNANGSLDLDFGPGGNVEIYLDPQNNGDRAYSLAQQLDGKILLAKGRVLLRYRSDGSLDSSFGVGGIVPFKIWNGNIVPLSSGKFLVAGISYDSNYFNNRRRPVVARFNSDGSLDTSHGASSGMAWTPDEIGNYSSFNNSALNEFSAALQPDGKLVVSTKILTDYDTTWTDIAVLRFIFYPDNFTYLPLVIK